MGRPLRHLVRRGGRARSPPPRTTCPASSPRASCCSRPRSRRPGAPRTSARSSTRSAVLRDEAAPAQSRYDAALSPELAEAMERAQGRHGMTRLEKSLPLAVDRVRARFGSWYEVFPRSWGGLKAVEELVPSLSELGFDVVYMTPIHPIGVTNRKGRNNTLVAGPDDPGSPYAVGGKEGGHDAVHPELGHGRRRPLAVRHGARARHGRVHGLRDQRVGRPPVAHASTRSGSTAARTARSSTPRTRPRSTRTSTTSTGSPRTGAACGTSGCGSSCSGSTPA